VTIEDFSYLNFLNKSNVNEVKFLRNDYNIVANSNIYSNPTSIIIEDKVEVENLGGRLPVSVLEILTKNSDGDFGATHSIFLLNRSLTLMDYLAKLENKNDIDVKKYTSIISASTAEKASFREQNKSFSSEFETTLSGDNNSIPFVINSLYRLFFQDEQNNIFIDDII